MQTYHVAQYASAFASIAAGICFLFFAHAAFVATQEMKRFKEEFNDRFTEEFKGIFKPKEDDDWWKRQ